MTVFGIANPNALVNKVKKSLMGRYISSNGDVMWILAFDMHEMFLFLYTYFIRSIGKLKISFIHSHYDCMLMYFCNSVYVYIVHHQLFISIKIMETHQYELFFHIFLLRIIESTLYLYRLSIIIFIVGKKYTQIG